MLGTKWEILRNIKPRMWKIEDDIETELKPALVQLLQEIQGRLLDDPSLPPLTLETVSHSLERGHWIIKLDKSGVKIIDSMTGEQQGRKISIEEYMGEIHSLDRIKRVIMNLEFCSEHPK